MGSTVINSGNVATKEVEQDIVEGKIGAQTPIPMGDLLQAFDFVLRLSSASVALEINLDQMFRA